MDVERDTARVRVVRKGLTMTAIERVARASFGHLPITLVDRARGQVRRFFSEGEWTVEDDAALSALVGPGEGWTEEELAPGIRISFGWRGGLFRVDIEADDDAEMLAAEEAEILSVLPVHERTLGDTFNDPIVIDSGRARDQLRFTIGPKVGTASGVFTRDEQGTSAAVATVFREFADVEQVSIQPGVVNVTVGDARRWSNILLPMFDSISVAFAPPRVVASDRQYERALSELGALDVANTRDLARVLDATTSPDASFRRVAVAMLEPADPLTADKVWARALEDSSRAVKRASIRAMAHVARPDLHAMYERALNDTDACVRYYGLRGFASIGPGRAREAVARCLRDDDIRVQLAAEAILEGRIPA